jgi:hypothetical protein
MCRCDCGVYFLRGQNKIRYSAANKTDSACSLSCPALPSKKKHGLVGTPIYAAWSNMLQRTRDPEVINWHRYGGRGIIVCDRWHKFTNFMEDMLPSYKKGLTLDRIDNDGNYEPDNCRWATQSAQCRNKGNNVILDTKYGRMTLVEAAEKSGIKEGTIRWRMKNGVPNENLLDPVHAIRHLNK